MNGFDVLQIAVGLCAIPIALLLKKYDQERRRASRKQLSNGEPEDLVWLALVVFSLAMALDFLGSLPGLGVGTKTALGQDVIEPLSHLAVVAVLVLGLWRCDQIGSRLVVFMAALGLVGFVCSTFVGEDTTVRHLANGLMPAYNWLITAVCVVAIVRIAYEHDEQMQSIVLFVLGLLALAAMAGQHDLIVQWANGNAHYPVLE